MYDFPFSFCENDAIPRSRRRNQVIGSDTGIKVANTPGADTIPDLAGSLQKENLIKD